MSTTVATQKVSILALVDAHVSKIASLERNAEGQFSSYPAGTLRYLGTTVVTRANTKRLYTNRFQLDVFIEQGALNTALTAERIAVEVADEIRTMVDGNVTLNQSVLEFRLESIDAGEENRELDYRTVVAIFQTDNLENLTN